MLYPLQKLPQGFRAETHACISLNISSFKILSELGGGGAWL